MNISGFASGASQAAQSAATQAAAAIAGGIMKTPKQNHRLYGFGYNQADLTQTHKSFLKKTIIPRILKGKTRVVLWGHTDRSGTVKHNSALAHKRMETTKQFLLDNLPAHQYAGQQGLNVSVDQIAQEFNVWRQAQASRR